LDIGLRVVAGLEETILVPWLDTLSTSC